MPTFNVNSVIEILIQLGNSTEYDIDKIDEAIDNLESIKRIINVDDDEAIDKVDEIQDYLQYLMTIKQPIMSEIKEEIDNMIKDLRNKS